MELITDQISLKIIFQNIFCWFGRDFSCSKTMFLSKALTPRDKKNEIIFVSLCFYLHQLKKRISDF